MTPYYADRDVTLYLGRAEDIVPALDYDTILTDPPYGKQLDYGEGSDDTHAAFCRIVHWLPSLGVPTIFTLPSTKLFDLPRPQWIGVWHKPLTMGFFHTPLIPHWEAIACYHLPSKGMHADVWRHNPVKPNGHPAPKPVGLWTELLTVLPAGVVLDPFLGSGTTAIAARLLGRPCIGVEVEERFLELAARRLSQGVLPLALLEEGA
jgi:site-specific DNA-methyltransferase (adenine-specific)